MKKLNVLIVEDRPDDALLVVKRLQRGGYDVRYERVETAAEMKQALEHDDWHVVLSDYSMPQFSALAALEVVKASRRDLPFIVVSGTVGEDVAVETMRLGAHDYILKGNLTRLCVAVERELRDVEQRKQRAHAEAALRESEARFLRLVENVPDIIYRLRLSPEPTLEYISRAAERVCGLARSELIGIPNALFKAVHPVDRERLGGLIEARDFAWGQLRWLHTDGTIRALDHRNTPVYRGDELVALEGAARDVTEQRSLEEQLEVAQRMEAVGRLAGGIAHDFNNLLTVINSLADIIIEDPSPGPELVEDLRQIREAGRAAANLTSQLLAFSRRQIRQVGAIDVNAVVANLERMLRRVIGEDISLVTALASDVPCVDADSAQVEQILMNLAVNARDAMPEGGNLTIETCRAQLDDEYARTHAHVAPGEYVKLAVSDDGSGMDEETRLRIFEPFFTTKGKGKGTGLGLSTVYGIVKQSDGHIFVYSEPGGGTAFKVYLPVSKQASPTPSEQIVDDDAVTGSETILLVEDAPAVRAIAARTLRQAGYEVLEPKDQDEAIGLAEHHPDEIHLLIADIVMPGMSGKQVADVVEKHRPRIKVLFMSGYTDNAIVHHGVLDAGIAFLPKPFTPATLRKKVRAVLDRAS